jgi:hypothetical protein
LFQTQLGGTLTSYIGQLTELTLLYVVNLNGCFHLSWIARRTLSTNQFNGSIPTQIGQMTALTHLCDAEFVIDFRASLTPNQFNGTIPTQIAQLTGLIYLYVAIVPGDVFGVHSRASSCRYLHNNQLSGTIPKQVAQLTKLGYLYVAIVPSGVSCQLRLMTFTSFFAGTCPPINYTAQSRHNLRN